MPRGVFLIESPLTRWRARTRRRPAKAISPRARARRASTDDILQHAVSELLARLAEDRESRTKAGAAVDKGLGLSILSRAGCGDDAGIGERHANGPRRRDSAVDDAKARKNFLHICNLRDLGDPAPKIEIVRCAEADAIAPDCFEHGAAYHDGGLDEGITPAQKCAQLLVGQWKVPAADDVVVDIDQVDAAAEKAQPWFLIHPGVLHPQPIRMEKVGAIEACKQWRAGDRGGEVDAFRRAQNILPIEPDPLVPLGPIGHDAIGAVATVVVDDDQLVVLESLVGETVQCRLEKAAGMLNGHQNRDCRRHDCFRFLGRVRRAGS